MARIVLALACAAFLAYRAANWLYRRALTLACMSPLPYASRFAAPLVVSYSLEGDRYFDADGCAFAFAFFSSSTHAESGSNANPW